MPRSCSICTRADRAEIDGGLTSGTPLRLLAKRTGTSTGSLIRHKQHLGGTEPGSGKPPRPLRADVVAAPQPAPSGPGPTIAPPSPQLLIQLATSAQRQAMQWGITQGDPRVVLWASDALLRTAVVQMKLDERDQQAAPPSPLGSPEIQALARDLLDALGDDPDARDAVAAVLERLAG